MNNIYDIFINGKFWGNINSANLIDAEARARQLISMSNPSITSGKFTLLQRVSPVEFNI